MGEINPLSAIAGLVGGTLLGGGGKSSAPDPLPAPAPAPAPPPPPPPAVMPTADDDAARVAARRETARRQSRSGRAATIFTGDSESERFGG